ncbi:PREDICTED: uncharacterized protein LOC104815009 [Tarenaya hassleriana]|uniref:uncharacterized protein LOC104815009 n=1 Tax=Tarenaya hassleriana TaxID=28532 RepID=UPI00053CA4CF|nr:PREDICTED: uncharacterized protein LOC104815009 [Tarenaya hassleriana]
MFSECSSSSSSSRSVRLGNRLRSPICCFGANAVEPEATIGPRTPRSPYAWLKSTAHELEIKDRCRRVKARIKGTHRNSGGNHNHHGSGDFSYDPLSYALNFEDDVRADEDESFPSFISRLPISPERKPHPAAIALVSV